MGRFHFCQPVLYLLYIQSSFDSSTEPPAAHGSQHSSCAALHECPHQVAPWVEMCAERFWEGTTVQHCETLSGFLRKQNWMLIWCFQDVCCVLRLCDLQTWPKAAKGRPWLQFFISCKASTVPGLVQHCCHHYLGGFPAARHQPVKVHAAYRKRNRPPTTSTLTCWVSSLNSSARPCQSQGSGLVTVWAGVLRRFWKVPSKQIKFSSILLSACKLNWFFLQKYVPQILKPWGS